MAVLVAVACSWIPAIQRLADGQVDAGLKRALASFAAVQGQVGSVGTDGRFVLQVKAQIGPGVAPGTTSLTVDPRQALFVRGQASCLAPGREVEVLGTVEAGVLRARLISVQGCTGQSSSGG